MAFVYILKGNNSRFYIGSTNNIERRITEHESGKSKYTKEVLPVTLIFTQEFETLQKARKVEYWLKKQKDANFIRRIITEREVKKTF